MYRMTICMYLSALHSWAALLCHARYCWISPYTKTIVIKLWGKDEFTVPKSPQFVISANWRDASFTFDFSLDNWSILLHWQTNCVKLTKRNDESHLKPEHCMHYSHICTSNTAHTKKVNITTTGATSMDSGHGGGTQHHTRRRLWPLVTYHSIMHVALLITSYAFGLSCGWAGKARVAW